MTITDSQTETLRQICSNVYCPGSQKYVDGAAPWSVWADRHPQLVVEPQDLATLQRIVKYLYDAKDIDFCVRNTGTGGSSASDVCISMHGFKQCQWDPKAESVILGAGLAWGEADVLMDEKTDGYACVGARCTWVGVTGGTLVGGLSWLSHEHGMTSDPQNFLDAQVVLSDGRAVWAAEEEPDLMWALRGGGGNFGVVSALKLRAYKTPKVFGAIISVPYSSLQATSEAVAAMHRRPSDPKMALHIVNQGPGMGTPDLGPKPDLALMLFDFRGEDHARNSSSGFQWAWQIPGAHELTALTCAYTEANALADSFKSYQGTNMFWLSAPLVNNIDDEMLVRAWKWYEDSYNLHPGFGAGSTVLLEFMQEKAFNSSGSRSATAWPHSGHKHVMQLVLGCPPDSTLPDGRPAKDNIREIVMKQFQKASAQIGKEHSTGEFHAGFLHEWNDLFQVYRENYGRLREVKKRYDPQNRFNKGVDLTEGKVTEGMTV